MYVFVTTYDPGGPHGQETPLTVLPPLTHREGGWRGRETAREGCGGSGEPTLPSTRKYWGEGQRDDGSRAVGQQKMSPSWGHLGETSGGLHWIR